jgi:two-component system cell cycle sensor histidine kinase/response regulator CckA
MNTTDAAAGRILVVEDELLVRIFAVDALEDAGFQVDEAGNAGEALAKLGRDVQRIRAAVVDLGLPDRAGDQLASEMHAVRADLPIVIASGRSERELRERFHGNRRIAVLGKPYTAFMLIDALASLGVAAQ